MIKIISKEKNFFFKRNSLGLYLLKKIILFYNFYKKMNKKITKIWILTLGLLALSVLLNTKTSNVNAGELKLEITWGTLTCTQLSSGLDLQYVQASFEEQIKTGALGGFSCTDLRGSWRNNEVNISSTNLTYSSYAITGIYFEMSPAMVVSGNCLVSSGVPNTYTNINIQSGWGSTALIFKKIENSAVCTIQVANSNIKVIIPASQAVGNYTATLTVNYPS